MSHFEVLIPVVLFLLMASAEVVEKNCGNSKNKVCVPRILCDNGAVIRDGRALFSFRTLLDGNEGCDTTEVCCAITDKVDTPIVPLDVSTPTECGHRNEMGLHTTMTDSADVAQVGEFPWMVALLRKSDKSYLKAGTLIGSDVVLTAAHVVFNLQAGEFFVRAGEWDFSIETEFYRHVDVDVRLIERHPDFQKSSGANNLALLFLSTRINPQPHISPACLPRANRNFDHSRCFVSGWGKKTFSSSSYMNILKKVEVPVVGRELCQQQLRRTILGSYFEIDSSLICAGGERGRDACKGDGGAPLVCPLANDNRRYEQAGIVNWGIGCGDQNTPALYTNVALFREWIDLKVSEKSVSRSNFDSGTGGTGSVNNGGCSHKIWSVLVGSNLNIQINNLSNKSKEPAMIPK
ncbi:phenoloxidase-activating factor 2-like [Drosophila obscura]|uniref:phenoloxidase-activating factor 2-like n=1 Tax=Drosophila obscura TaxID=7282 RepID=UPI001BB13CA0|nr:phenoloxidase-activating factor 2-like [Drosophila obscura]